MSNAARFVIVALLDGIKNQDTSVMLLDGNTPTEGRSDRSPMKQNRKPTPSQGRDLDIGSRPVETTQHADVTRQTEVAIPRAQAAWVALPLSVAVIVTIVSPIALGPRIFWCVAGVMALAAFLWSVQFEMMWQDRVTLPFLVGLVALSFYRFVEWQRWTISPDLQPVPAILTVGALVFWWTFTGALWLTFMQRLGMPLYHQQYSLWKAIGNLVEHKGKQERPQAQAQVEERRIVFEFHRNGGQKRDTVHPPVDDDTLVWVCRVLQEETFSEASLCGTDKPLAGGDRETLRVLREWMVKWDLLRWNVTNGNGEPVTTQGVSLTADGLRWIEEVGRG